jgi:hypothetical protein
VSASIDFTFINFKVRNSPKIKILTKKTEEETTLTFNFLTNNAYY